MRALWSTMSCLTVRMCASRCLRCAFVRWGCVCACCLTCVVAFGYITPCPAAVVVDVALRISHIDVVFAVLISGEGCTARLDWAHDVRSMADDARGARQMTHEEAHPTMQRGPP